MLDNILGKTSFSKARKFFQKGEKSFLGLDIGASSIKLAQLKKSKGGAVLETYGELSLGPYANTGIGRATNLTNKQISSAVIDLVKESRVSVMKCGASIPLRSSLIFEMEIPKVSSDQLKKIVPIEARRYIPISISEVTLDWMVIPENDFDDKGKDSLLEDSRPATQTRDTEKNEKIKKQNKTKIFVAAIHKNAIEKYKDIIKNAQLNLDFLEIEIFSTIRSVVEHNAGTAAILDIGSGITKLYIVEYGVVKRSHLINRGSQDISLAISKSLGIPIEEAEKRKREVGLIGIGETTGSFSGDSGGQDKIISDIISTHLQYIFSETGKILVNYQKEYNKNINKIIFTGGGAVVKGLPELASKSLEVKTVMADPFAKIKTPAFLDDVLKEIGPEFAVAVGLALRGLEKQGM